MNRSLQTILVLIPIKPNLADSLVRSCHTLADRLVRANPEHTLEILFDRRGTGDSHLAGQPLPQRAQHLAPLRQAIIDDHLRPRHDAVLWIDADLIDYPADLPTQLARRSEGGIVAPVVTFEGQPSRFYDIAGFVEADRWARMQSPWFDQPGPVFQLDSVGCIYLAPADVYRRGARHEPTPGFTEHYSVCRKAREWGLSVRAFADLVAVHADLELYGEQHH